MPDDLTPDDLAPDAPSTSDTPAPDDAATADPDRWLILFLRVVGWTTLLAFAAAVMPQRWIIETAEALGFDPFPDSPLTFYLARNLSLVYGFGGIGLLVITMDFDRYRPLIRYLAIGTMAFGVLQLIVDAQSALPYWWSFGEATSTFCGGVAIAWLDHRSRAKQSRRV